MGYWGARPSGGAWSRYGVKGEWRRGRWVMMTIDGSLLIGTDEGGGEEDDEGVSPVRGNRNSVQKELGLLKPTA